MAVQIPFPEDANFPPERSQSRSDTIIDHIFQVLPACSVVEITNRLTERGLLVTINSVRKVIQHLRSHADYYQWTIPHVNGTARSELKYFAVILEKDKSFHLDGRYETNMRGGTWAIVNRIATESKNQSVMLQAVSHATYLHRSVRDELAEMADECIGMHKKARRVLRYLKANNG